MSKYIPRYFTTLVCHNVSVTCTVFYIQWVLVLRRIFYPHFSSLPYPSNCLEVLIAWSLLGLLKLQGVLPEIRNGRYDNFVLINLILPLINFLCFLRNTIWLLLPTYLQCASDFHWNTIMLKALIQSFHILHCFCCPSHYSVVFGAVRK